MEEVWKKHPTLNIEVSNLGNIKRLTGSSKGICYSGTKCRHYKIISANKTTYYIHRLLVETFIGLIPIGCEINHKNGNQSDNRLENLEIVSHLENVKRGKKPYRKIISDKEVLKIYKLVLLGKNNTEISKIVNIGINYISRLRNGSKRKDLWDEYFKDKVIPPYTPKSIFSTKEQIKIIKRIINGESPIWISREYKKRFSYFYKVKNKEIWKNTWELVENKNN